MVKPRNDRKWFGHRLNNSLNCSAGLWTFLRLKDVKISLYIIVLIVRGCIDQTHKVTCRVKINYFCKVRALCFCIIMISYQLQAILLIRNHMIFLVQFGNKQALVNLFKDHKLHKPHGLVQFCWSLKKFIPAHLFQIALETTWLPIQVMLVTSSLGIMNIQWGLNSSVSHLMSS